MKESQQETQHKIEQVFYMECLPRVRKQKLPSRRRRKTVECVEAKEKKIAIVRDNDDRQKGRRINATGVGTN